MENRLSFYDAKEEKLNVISHGLGLLLSIIAFIVLILKAVTHHQKIYLITTVIYGVSLLILYAASTFYHASKKPAIRYKLNILDHAAIYVLIAGTYTPFSLITLNGWVGYTVFGISWSLAIIGIVLKLFFTGKYEKASTIAYVLMGWLIILAIKPLINSLSLQGLLWLFAGGFFYTFGAFLYSKEKIKYNHAIFHIFVLLGSFTHFMAVYYHVL